MHLGRRNPPPPLTAQATKLKRASLGVGPEAKGALDTDAFSGNHAFRNGEDARRERVGAPLRTFCFLRRRRVGGRAKVHLAMPSTTGCAMYRAGMTTTPLAWPMTSSTGKGVNLITCRFSRIAGDRVVQRTPLVLDCAKYLFKGVFLLSTVSSVFALCSANACSVFPSNAQGQT